MKQYRLNGLFMATKEKAHRHIKRRLHLPDYYGNNLDALWDCLTETGDSIQITIVHAAYLEKKLGPYGKKLISVLLAATGENPKVHVVVKERF